MKMIIIVGLLFPLLYIGCGESENKSSKVASVERQKNDINVTSKVKELDFLKELGLDIQNEKISIDINKTTNFFQKMEIEMHGKADELQHKIQKADINFTRDLGIDFSDDKLAIDFNKTKKMFQQINILMKEVLLDRNSSKS
jgi:hypothetical protein